MTETPDHPLAALIAGSLDNLLGDVDRDRLCESLETDAQFRQTYVRMTLLDSLLHSEHRAASLLPEILAELQEAPQADEALQGETQQSETQQSETQQDEAAHLPRAARYAQLWTVPLEVVRTNLAASLMIAGLTVTIIVLSLALIVPDWERSAPVANTPSTEFVARIARTSQADFDKTSNGNFQNRDLFDDDTIVLHSGLVVIEYDTGARVVLEGPATYQVQGANGGDLRHGGLVARVDTKASQGFFVDVPGARIVDLGTEFAVEVDADGASDVAVLSGEVELTRTTLPERSVRLTAGKIASIDGQSGEITRQGDIAPQLASAMRRRLETLALAQDAPGSRSIAAYIVKPIVAKQSTFFSATSGDRAGHRTNDGTGLSDATTVETGDSVPGIWPSHSNTTSSPATMWLSTNVAGGSSEGAEWVMYDLGAEYLLGGLHQWNYNESGNALGNGMQDVTIKFATSSAGFDAGNQGHASWGSDFATTFASATGWNTYTGQTIHFDRPRTARYVLLDTTTTWGDTYNRTGLSEIRFITAGAQISKPPTNQRQRAEGIP